MITGSTWSLTEKGAEKASKGKNEKCSYFLQDAVGGSIWRGRSWRPDSNVAFLRDAFASSFLKRFNIFSEIDHGKKKARSEVRGTYLHLAKLQICTTEGSEAPTQEKKSSMTASLLASCISRHQSRQRWWWWERNTDTRGGRWSATIAAKKNVWMTTSWQWSHTKTSDHTSPQPPQINHYLPLQAYPLSNVTPHTSISIQYACISWMPKFHFMYNISFPCILHKIEDFPSCFGTRFCAVPLWRKSRSWTLTYKLETVFLAAGFLSKLQCNLRVPSASRAPTRGSNSSVQFHCCGAKWDVELWHIS